MSHMVYRVRDIDDRLIYIGASGDVYARMDTHMAHTWWYDLAAWVEAEPYPNRTAALAAEAVAIQEEQPAFNYAHTGRGPGNFGHLTEADLEHFRQWLVERRPTAPLPKYLHNYVYRLDSAEAA